MKIQKKILLVDDNVELCNGLAELFRNEGYHVDHTSDSATGANLIKRNRYDIGVLDYKMKYLNGIDLLKMIKNVNPECSVFIISAKPSINEIIGDHNVGGLIAGVFHKPFDIETLLKQLREL